LEPENLSERASRIAQEAKMLQEAIDRFGPGFEKLVNRALRRSAVEEVQQAFQKVMQEVPKRELEIELLVLGRDKGVWVVARRGWSHLHDRHTYSLSAAGMKREEITSSIAAGSFEKGVIYITVENFNDLVSELKTSILEGKLDEHVHLTAEHLIYYKMTKSSPYTLVRKKKRIG